MKSTPRVLILASPFIGYLRGLMRGIARYGRAHGPWEFFVSGLTPGVPLPALQTFGGRLLVSSPSASRPDWLADDIRRWGITGVIGRMSAPEVAKAVLASGLPTVALDLTDKHLAAGNPLSQLPDATTDCRAAGRLAAEHLLGLGLRRFAFVGQDEQAWSYRREAGFRERLAEAGHEYAAFNQANVHGRNAAARTRARVAEWLGGLGYPAGVFAGNDYVGREVLDASLEVGIEVPDQLAVVGADDDDLSNELANPPLSSVAFNVDDGGYRIAELLNRLMSEGNGWQRRDPARLVIEAVRVVSRPSSAAMAVEDPLVATALRFIRTHAKEAIDVADVVRHCAVSQRSLGLHFQAVLGSSVKAELQRVRIDWAKRLLAETGLSIEKVADNAGFGSLSYFCHAFRRATGTTPAEYRHRYRVC
ncbi:MAG: substrate-binding domain-containing protein [Patescibacteria group bacterium]|nr:substrate-binding domain-containing protein [Patescibacteria group bacterium]